MAQIGGWTIALSTGWQYVAILLRIDKVSLPAGAPGDQLILKADVLSINESGSLIEGRAEVNGDMVAHAERIMYGNSPCLTTCGPSSEELHLRQRRLLDREGNVITR